MLSSKLMVGAALAGLALGLLHGCTARSAKSLEEESLADSVVASMYTERRFVTGSHIRRQVDRRVSVESQSAQPLRVFEAKP